MSKTIQVELTKSELELLCNLVGDNINNGTYWGNKDYFVVMQAKTLEKLTDALEEIQYD